jgi:hypothetical protein
MRGSIRKRGHTYTWYLDVVDPLTGKRRQASKGGFRTKREAQHALNGALANLRAGSFVEPSTRTLGSFLENEWLPAAPSALDLVELPNERRGPHHPGAGRHGPPAPQPRAAHRLLPGAAGRRAPGRARRPGAQDGPEHPRHAARCPPRRRPLGPRRPQRRRRRPAAARRRTRDAGLDPGAAPDLPGRRPRRPALRRLAAVRHYRHASRGAGRAALGRRRPGRRPRLPAAPPGGRRLPGHRLRSQDG